MVHSTPAGATNSLRRATPGSIVARLIQFGVLWWALTEADRYNWWFGAFMVIFATLVSLAMLPPAPWDPVGIVRFVPFFVRHSILGGVDVARRAFSPDLPLDPGFIDIPLHLPDGPTRVMLANTLSLLPGTVSVELHPTHLRMHVLDRTMPIERTAWQAEERIAHIVGIELPDSRQ